MAQPKYWRQNANHFALSGICQTAKSMLPIKLNTWEKIKAPHLECDKSANVQVIKSHKRPNPGVRAV